MSYQKTNWKNTPSTKTSINAENLNKMEDGIYEAHQSFDNIPEWSKQPEKPTYTAEEIGSLDESEILKLAITPTATGTQIVARDSAEWPIQALTVYGRSEQFKTNGKNLFNINGEIGYRKITDNNDNGANAVADGVITVNTNADINACAGAKISVAPNTNYTFSCNVLSFGTGSSVYFSVNGTEINLKIVNFNSLGKASATYQTGDNDTELVFGVATKSGTGAKITDVQVELGSTATEYEPYTGGKPSPSPDYPQPIVSAGERLSTGKNLFSANGREVREPGGGGSNTELRNNLNGSGIYVGITMNNYYNPQNVISYDVSDNSVSLSLKENGNGYGIGFDIKVTPGQVYTISNDLSEQIGASFYTEQGEVVGTGASSAKSHTVTVPDNAYWMMIVFRPSPGATYTYTNIQLEIGSTSTAYEPYTGGVPAAYPVGVEVAVSGKNLLDPDALSYSSLYWTYSDGVWSTGSAEATYVYIDRCLKAGTYVLSVYCDSIQNGKGKLECRKDSTTIAANYFTNTGRKEVKIDIDEDGEYRLLFGGTNHESLMFSRPQFELGSTATAYEPYRGRQTVTLASTNGLPGIPVSSGGNYTDADGQQWVCDTIEYRGGQAVYVQRVWVKEFDGSNDEKWAEYNSTGNEGFCVIDALPEKHNRATGFCNLLTVHSDTAHIGEEGLWFGVGNGTVIYCHSLRFYDATLEDKGLANWKAYLAAHPMTVITYLTTPIETPLTEAEAAQLAALHTHKPTTTVTNDAGAEMDVTYVADTKAYIDNKFAELQAAQAITNAQLI